MLPNYPPDIIRSLETANNIRRAKSFHHFMQPSGGFLERAVPSGIPPSDQFYRITKLQCDPAKRPEAVATLAAHAKYLWKNTNETLSYFVVTHMEDPDGFMLLERYPSEAIARVIWSLRNTQAVVSKVSHFNSPTLFEASHANRPPLFLQLLSLNVTQMTTDYRAVGGFLSKKEKVI